MPRASWAATVLLLLALQAAVTAILFQQTRSMQASIRALQNYDLREVFSTISVPTLLVVGEKDGTLPGIMKQINNSIPGSALIEIPRAGHLPNVEKPEAFNRAIEPFLRGAAPQKSAGG